jgi:hypothetical protein
MTARELDTVVLFAALGGGLSADGRVEGAHTR